MTIIYTLERIKCSTPRNWKFLFGERYVLESSKIDLNLFENSIAEIRFIELWTPVQGPFICSKVISR